jgi:hypothetical protein
MLGAKTRNMKKKCAAPKDASNGVGFQGNACPTPDASANPGVGQYAFEIPRISADLTSSCPDAPFSGIVDRDAAPFRAASEPLPRRALHIA